MKVGVISSGLSDSGLKEAKLNLASPGLPLMPSLSHLMMSFIFLSQYLPYKSLTGNILIVFIYTSHCAIISGIFMGK